MVCVDCSSEFIFSAIAGSLVVWPSFSALIRLQPHDLTCLFLCFALLLIISPVPFAQWEVAFVWLGLFYCFVVVCFLCCYCCCCFYCSVVLLSSSLLFLVLQLFFLCLLHTVLLVLAGGFIVTVLVLVYALFWLHVFLLDMFLLHFLLFKFFLLSLFVT